MENFQSYGYTDAFQGDYSELVYLRARQYSPGLGRFLTRDTWMGNRTNPASFNKWAYANANPISRTDPSGYYACVEFDEYGRCIEKEPLSTRLPGPALSIPSDPEALLSIPAQDIQYPDKSGPYYYNLCGQFSAESIIEAINGGHIYSINSLIAQHNTRAGIGNWELGELLASTLGNRAQVYGYLGKAIYKYTGNENYGSLGISVKAPHMVVMQTACNLRCRDKSAEKGWPD